LRSTLLALVANFDDMPLTGAVLGFILKITHCDDGRSYPMYPFFATVVAGGGNLPGQPHVGEEVRPRIVKQWFRDTQTLSANE